MSQFISLATAIAMTTLYRQDKETVLATAYKNQDILPICETFDRDVFDDVLAQTGCLGIRIYYGMDGDNKIHAIIVGVNDSDEDIIVPISIEYPNTSLVIETGNRCPDICPPTSDLNS